MRKIKLVWTNIKFIWAYAYHVFKRGDFDWDWGYLFALLRWKLNRMREVFLIETHINGNLRIVKQIDYAIFLLDRIECDPLTEGMFEVYREVYGRPIIRDRRIVNSKELTEEQEDECNLEFMKLMGLEADRRHDFETRLFRHLKQYYRGWWS